MTILTSANGSLPLTLRKGETLVIRNYSGTDAVTGSAAAREDVSATLGSGAYAYGPQPASATLTLSSSGSLDYQVVSGDVTPAINALVSQPTGQIVTPSGGVVDVDGRGGRPSFYTRVPIGSTSTAFGTAVNQVRYYVPFGGQTVQARLVYRNTNTSTEMVVADSAIASGRSFDDVNPLSLTGSAVPFVALGSGKTFPAAPSATVATIGRSDWMTVNVIEDPDRPGWGTIYVRNKFTSGGETWVYGGGTGQAEYNAAASLFKSANDWQLTIAIGDNITVPTADYRRVFGIEIRSTGGGLATVAAFGDSRTSGYGTAGNQHGWASRACSDLNAGGLPVGFENWGLLNSVSSTFMDRLDARLALGDCPDIVLWQPGSNNDTDAWTESVVTAQIARMIEAKEKVEALGGVFVPVTMFPSAGANTAEKAAQWSRLNQAARSSRYFVEFDVAPFNNGDAIPALPSSLTTDGTHVNDTWQQVLAGYASAVIRQVIGQ